MTDTNVEQELDAPTTSALETYANMFGEFQTRQPSKLKRNLILIAAVILIGTSGYFAYRMATQNHAGDQLGSNAVRIQNRYFDGNESTEETSE